MMAKIKDALKSLSRYQIALVAAALLLVVFVGYNLHNQQSNTSTKKADKAQSLFTQDVSNAPDIQNTLDLDQAAKVLDQNDPAISSLDSKEIDNQSAGF
jgi:cytoskeletal protein RodZ